MLFLGSLLKQCSVFKIFSHFSLPPPYTKLKLAKKILDTRVQHCLLAEGRGWTCVNWKTPQKYKSVPKLLSMNVGLTLGSVRFSLYLLLVICVYRSNAHGSLPTYVPPPLIQTTVTRTFAKPVVNLSHVSQHKGPVQMQTGLWSTCKRFTELQESFRNKPYERQNDPLEVQLWSFLRSLVPPKKFYAAIAEDIVKFLISMDAAGKQKLHVHSCSSKT